MDNAMREVFALLGFGRETQRISCHHNFTQREVHGGTRSKSGSGRSPDLHAGRGEPGRRGPDGRTLGPYPRSSGFDSRRRLCLLDATTEGFFTFQ